MPINGQKVINTSLKPEVIHDAFDQKIGFYLQSGVINTPYGIRFYYSTPIVEPLSVGLQFDYLTDFKSNQNLVASLSISSFRINIIGWYIYNYIDFNYRKLHISNIIEFESYTIENHARFYGNTIILGCSKIDYSLYNNYSISKYGLVAGYEKEFIKLHYLTIEGKIGVHKKLIEYQMQFDLPFKRVKTFVSINKINKYQEITIGVGYKIYYYYRFQNNANKY